MIVELTIEEAIKILRNFDLFSRVEEDTEALKMAIKSLRMQIPKRPNGGECTCCGGDVGIYQVPYCQCCGQALDWSDIYE